MEFIELSFKCTDLPANDVYDNESRQHKGTYTKDCCLYCYDASGKQYGHFWLSDFVREGNYMFNERLIELLEAMFANFTAIKGMYISSAYRTSQPGNYLSMHNLGGAVDIAWLDAPDKDKGNRLDARYIAVAASRLGFSGIAPLEKYDGNTGYYANSIHLDVRSNAVWDGGSLWYGYERDPDGDGWFKAYSHYGAERNNPKVFCDWYKITEEEALTYLCVGTASTKLSPIKQLLMCTNSKTTPVFKILTNTNFTENYSIKYKIKYENGELDGTVEKEGKTEIKENKENYLTFEITNLSPGTSYSAEIELIKKSEDDSSTETIKAGVINFTTIQDYPQPGRLSSSLVTNGNKNTPLAEYSIKFNIPNSYKCYWEDYWKNKHNKNYKGHTLSIIVDGTVVTTLPKAESPFCFVPKDYNIPFGTNIQLGLQTWIRTDKKINENEYECIVSELVCSNPIYLDSPFPQIKRLYVKDDKVYVRIMISDLKEVN